MYPLIFTAIFMILQTTWICEAKPTAKLVEMPVSCKDKTFCFTKHEDYPQKIVDDLLQDVDEMFEEADRYHGSSRNNTQEGPDDCESRVYMRPIYEIVDKKGNVRFVVQSDKNFRQVIRIEECVKPGRIEDYTYNFSSIQVQMFNLVCVETYIPYKFVVLSLDHKSIETVWVKGGVPVSCSTQLVE